MGVNSSTILMLCDVGVDLSLLVEHRQQTLRPRVLVLDADPTEFTVICPLLVLTEELGVWFIEVAQLLIAFILIDTVIDRRLILLLHGHILLNTASAI